MNIYQYAKLIDNKQNFLVGLYIIYNNMTNEVYVGSTNRTNSCKYTRNKDHFRHLKAERNDSTHLQNSYNKYGINAFEFLIFEECHFENQLEQWAWEKATMEFFHETLNFKKLNVAEWPSGFSSEEGTKYGKLGGAIQGPKNVESGQLKLICSQGGKTVGIKHKKSGHIQNLGRKFGPIYGRIQGKIQGQKNKNSGFIQELGRKQGNINVQSGHLNAIRTTEHQIEAGKKAAISNAKNGKGLCGLTYEQRVENGKKSCKIANHKRWHLNKNKLSLKCSLCFLI